MSTSLALLAGAALGALIAWLLTGLVLRARHATANATATERASNALADKDRLTAENSQLSALNSQLSSALAATKADASARLAAEQQRFAEQEKRAAQYLADIEKFRATFQTEFQAVAAKLLDEKSAKFTEHNKTQIDTILSPLRQQLTDFRTRIETVYKTENDDRSGLKAQIEQLRQLNTRITDEAHALTRALKGQSQARGAWGELVLDRLLTAAGLRQGEDYLAQESLTTDDGRRLRPDVILRLPDQRHLVIDSKLSLIAYEKCVNADDDTLRAAALAEHLRAVRTHVEELAGKRYEDTGRLVTPDYVLMFVPLEPAFTLALENDQGLYEWALERRIVLCTAPTLLVTLKTVALLWKQDRQTKNVQEIARRGGLLYDKFAGLYTDLEQIGQQLSRTHSLYDDALAKLKTGRGNLLSQVEELKTLGAKAQKTLPAADAREG